MFYKSMIDGHTCLLTGSRRSDPRSSNHDPEQAHVRDRQSHIHLRHISTTTGITVGSIRWIPIK